MTHREDDGDEERDEREDAVAEELGGPAHRDAPARGREALDQHEEDRAERDGEDRDVREHPREREASRVAHEPDGREPEADRADAGEDLPCASPWPREDPRRGVVRLVTVVRMAVVALLLVLLGAHGMPSVPFGCAIWRARTYETMAQRSMTGICMAYGGMLFLPLEMVAKS